MIDPTPTRTLLTTTFAPLVLQLSGALARGTRLIEQFVQHEPTPQDTMDFERELSHLLREVGRRIMPWALNQLEPQADAEAPSRSEFDDRLYRRRRQALNTVATLWPGGPLASALRTAPASGPLDSSLGTAFGD